MIDISCPSSTFFIGIRDFSSPPAVAPDFSKRWLNFKNFAVIVYIFFVKKSFFQRESLI